MVVETIIETAKFKRNSNELITTNTIFEAEAYIYVSASFFCESF